MITDEDGNVVKEKKYEAFGNLIWAEGTYEDNREFTGKEKEPTGFHYFGARYYYGNIGRFLTPDPATLMPNNLELGNSQALNPYVYCENNPLIFYDPDGLRTRVIMTNNIITGRVYNGVPMYEKKVYIDGSYSGTFAFTRDYYGEPNLVRGEGLYEEYKEAPPGTFYMTEQTDNLEHSDRINVFGVKSQHLTN
jgi:RHS repeat-associated protein